MRSSMRVVEIGSSADAGSSMRRAGGPRNPGAGNEIVHSIEAANECALTAPRRADKGSHRVSVHVETHALERRRATVGHTQVGNREHVVAALDFGALEPLRYLGDATAVYARSFHLNHLPHH